MIRSILSMYCISFHATEIIRFSFLVNHLEPESNPDKFIFQGGMSIVCVPENIIIPLHRATK